MFDWLFPRRSRAIEQFLERRDATWRHETRIPLPETDWSQLEDPEFAQPEPVPPTEREQELLATIEEQNDTMAAMQHEIVRMAAIESATRDLILLYRAAAIDGQPIFKLRRREDPEMATQIGMAFTNLAYALGTDVPEACLGDERTVH